MTANNDHDLPEAEPGRETLVFAIDDATAGRRLDAALAEAAERGGVTLSRTRGKALIEGGFLSVDARPVTEASAKLKAGCVVTLILPEAEDAEPKGEAIPLAVVFEDRHLLVVNKPAGLVVHPAPGHPTGTLVNALIAHCGDSLSGIGGVRRPGIVHRLDKDTSGLLVVAKTDAAHHGLAALFADHGRTLALQRSYAAFVWGAPDRGAGTVEAPLGRHPHDRLRMAVVPEERGRAAITHWRLEATFGPRDQLIASRLACHLETGRTHQIRVHMAQLGHPVLADPLYGKGFRTKRARLSANGSAAVAALGERQALHAAHLGFVHPITGQELAFDSPLPDDLARLESALAT